MGPHCDWGYDLNDKRDAMKIGVEHVKEVQTGVLVVGPTGRTLFIPGLKKRDPRVYHIIKLSWPDAEVMVPLLEEEKGKK